MTKPTIRPVLPAKTQISLYINTTQYDKGSQYPSLDSLEAVEGAISKDSDQTAQMCRPVWVFAGRSNLIVGFVMCWLIYHKQLKIDWKAFSQAIFSFFFFSSLH